jgi:cytochrome oxidase Cu insertion factor (SCO1/SenC/PrrC family)
VKARAILIAFALVLPSAAGARVDSSAFPQLAFGQHPGAQLPRDAQLTNEAGKPTTLGRTLNGRPAILVLEYLRCRSLCSLVLAGAVNALQQAQLTPGKQLAHPAGFVVVTPSGTISRYMLGLNPDPGLLRQAVNEAGQGTVEPPAHPLLLLCFGYDPDEGTAAALAMRLVRWVSFAAVLGCAALIGFLSLRRRAA